ncbi:uncharacterized protein MISP3 isoform X2 [Phyllobates terribilis]|uniref:uncharacterized protein MISP3 isoform X2 n=1 Tax=Phyllobates terribilis TaxID=111132 RepID=UPI003CCAF3A6
MSEIPVNSSKSRISEKRYSAKHSMASEQKLSSTGDNLPNTTSTGEPINPTNDSERPSFCTSDAEHKGEPESHPVTGVPEDGRGQVEGANDGCGVNTGEREGAGTEERQKEGEKRAEEKVTNENTSHQVPKVEVSENKEEVHVGLLVSVDESDPSEEEGAAQRPQVAGVETEGYQINGQVSDKQTGSEITQVTGEGTSPLVTGKETSPQVTGEGTAPQVTGEGTAPLATGKETVPKVTGKETAPQVTGKETVPKVTGKETVPKVTGEGTAEQVTGAGIASQVTGEGAAPQVTCEETSPLVTGEGTEPLVTCEETSPQVTVEVTVPQVTAEETEPHKETGLKETDEESEAQTKMEETYFQSTSVDASEQVAGEERFPPKTDADPAAEATIPERGESAGSEEQRGAQVTGTGVQESIDAQVSDAGERWIELLVHSIVTEAAGQGARAGEQDTGVQVPVCAEVADTIAVRIEEEEHSTVQVTGTETMAGEQVTAQAAGAAAQVNTDRQVFNDSTDIALHVSGEEPGLQVRAKEETPEQVTAEATGTDRQVDEAAACREDSEAAQVTVIGEEVQECSSHVEVGAQVTASGEEADREVTPDLVALAGREGTLDQDQQAACREKEWPPLICTVSEVRTVTAAQGDTPQGSPTQKDASKTPEMKEREIEEDGHSPTPETPIEREIRLTMEREMTLRQERGISSPIGQQPQLVEVRRKTILVEPVAVPGKERQLAGAQMQREIQLETQREKDLVDLGKVMGTYDRGPQQELQEKKMIFESMNTEPSDVPPMKKKQSEPQQQPKPQEAPPSSIPVSTNHVVPAKITKKGPSYAEANGSNVIIIEHSSLLRRSAPTDSRRSAPADSHRSDPSDSRRSAPADSQRSAPVDSRRSVSAEISYTNSSRPPVINSAGPPTPSGSPYQQLQSLSPSSLLEREIEEVNERERELRRQRSSIYGRDESDGQTNHKTQEVASDIQSVYQPERPSWRKLEVNWPPNKEAAMNGQVSDSPRTRRQRSALIQSWERGNPNPKDEE